MSSAFQRYLLPGVVFQSIGLAGGYGTGRELAEFFLRFGPVGGLLGMLAATTLISMGCMVSFELARMTRTYDYRAFLKRLLGRAWFIYEISYLSMMMIVLAVIASATGTLFLEAFALPPISGTLLLLAAVAFLAFKGTRLIEGILSAWSFVLYAAFLVFLVLSFRRFGPEMLAVLTTMPTQEGWLSVGLRYGALQLALAPAILFATTHIRQRREAVSAGALTGPIMMVPGVFLYCSMMAHYPAVMDRPVPVNYVIQLLESPLLAVVFPVVLIGTFIETGTGLIHAVNERIAGWLRGLGRGLPDYARSAVAIVLIVGALLLSRFGIIDLIARGYGLMTWIFIGIFVVPLLTIGVRKILRSRGS